MIAVEPRPDRAAGVPDERRELLDRLRPWPGILEALAARGCAMEVRAEDTLAQVENRIGTQLMALYRDTRGRDAFEALYAFAEPAVLRWIQGLLRRGLQHLDAAELLQDTFVNVYRYPASFREDHAGSFRVWVRTIAGNIVRRAGARRSTVSYHELPEGLQEPEDSRGNPEQLAVLDEQRDRLRVAWMLFLCHYARAWDQLGPRDRHALELVEVRELSYAQAGKILRVGRSNMKMIVFRSRKRIAARMRTAMASGPSRAARARPGARRKVA